MFSLLAAHYRKGIARYFQTNTAAKTLTATAFLVVLFGLALLIHEGFYYGFLYISKDAFFGEAVSIYIIELFLLVSSFLTFTSALVSGVVSLYRDDEGGMIMASPRYPLKPMLVLFRMFLSSLWPLMVVIIPAILAILQVFPLSLPGVLLALFGSVLLVFIAVVAAMLLLFFCGAVLNSFRAFSRLRLVFFAGACFLLLTLTIGMRFRSVNLVNFFQARLLSVSSPDLTPILHQFSFFPSHLVTMTIYDSMHSMFPSALVALGALLALAVLLFAVLVRTGKYHLRYWQIAQEHGGAGRMQSRSMGGGALVTGAVSPLGALRGKELMLFVRNVRGMLWLGFILVVWGIQSASSFLLMHRLDGEQVTGGALPSVAMSFQFALITYFVAMFALRFAFPSFSEEKKSDWVVWSAPLATPSVFRAKSIFFCSLFSILALCFAGLNARVTGVAPAMMFPLFVLVCIATVSITAFALSLGALFPNAETDDPEVLSTSLPGLVFIIIAVLYGALGAASIRLFLLEGEFAFVLLYAVMSVILTSAFIAKTVRAIR